MLELAYLTSIYRNDSTHNSINDQSNDPAYVSHGRRLSK